MAHPRLTPALTPRGHLRLVASEDAPELDPALARRLRDAFDQGAGHALLQLGGTELRVPLPPALAYWRELGTRYVTAIATQPNAERHHTPPPPDAAELQTLALGAPAMPGAEYVTSAVLEALWHELDAAFTARLAQTETTVDQLLKQLDPAWNVVGRVHFNLAQNPRDDAPFAFLASYTHQLSAHGRAQLGWPTEQRRSSTIPRVPN